MSGFWRIDIHVGANFLDTKRARILISAGIVQDIFCYSDYINKTLPKRTKVTFICKAVINRLLLCVKYDYLFTFSEIKTSLSRLGTSNKKNQVISVLPFASIHLIDD